MEMWIYLQELREAHRFNNVGRSEPMIVANDIVVVHNESQPRGTGGWLKWRR